MKTFDRKYIEKELSIIDKHLKSTIAVYILGGGAMSFNDLKAATKDIDIVVRTENESRQLLNALYKSGYKNIEHIDPIYQRMKTRAIIENTDGFRWDIFVNTVCCGLTLSKTMMSRSNLFKRLPNMIIYLVSPEDIFIFKAVTSRPRDREDMFTLFTHGLNIDAVRQEIRVQAQMDQQNAWLSFFFIGLDELVEEYNVVFPGYDEFLGMAEHEMMERLITEFIKQKPRTLNELTVKLKCDENELIPILVRLQKQKLIIKTDDKYSDGAIIH